tara:strand:- start:360 stop:830 length:471 start_codon:yes stop_codon:yes gene_type:complete
MTNLTQEEKLKSQRERLTRWANEMIELGCPYRSIVREGLPFTKEMLPEIEEDIIDYQEEAKRVDKNNYHKDYYSNTNWKKINRLKKLKELISFDLYIKPHGHLNFGLVEINRKYIVSLVDNNWRTVYKNKWYKHKKDLSDFVNNYILKDFPNEINT